MNNSPPNRGSAGITSMRHYEWNDEFYKAICKEEEYNKYNRIREGFPQQSYDNLWKTKINWGKRSN